MVPPELIDAINKEQSEAGVCGGKNITSYELLAILLGVETFAWECSGRSVQIWTDNTGGEGALRKRAARRIVHNAIVHYVWWKAASLGMGVFVERVPTEVNIADSPSRSGDDAVGTMLQRLGAEFREARLPAELSPWGDVRALFQ